MHQEAVRMLVENPLLKDRMLEILARWESQVSSHSKPLRDHWFEIISNENWSLALEDSELGNQLRQASPMAILLPEDVRLKIILTVSAEKKAMRQLPRPKGRSLKSKDNKPG